MLSFLRRGINHKELALATRHLGLMVKSGVAITRALEVLGNEASPQFKAILVDLAERIKKGESFSEALKSHSQFSRLYVSMVGSAEAAGNLDEVLQLLATQLERDVDLQNRVKNALMYPAVVVSAMLAIGILMMILVVPRLAETFKGLGVPLPVTTRAIIAVSALLKSYWFLLPVVIGGFIFGLRSLGRREKGRAIFSWLALHMPVAKSIAKKMQIARFARTLSSLMHGGVAVLEALAITRGTLQNKFYRDSLVTLAERVEKGEALSKAMAGFEKLYPALIVQMIVVGEETGALAEILKHLADFYENEVTETTKALSTMIEPILMVVIGAGVGFFAVSMIQPMYGLLNAL